jgi:FAD/FMN-containing dehydrogenase
VRLVNFGHLGDGNLHYNVQAPVGEDGARFLAEEEHRVNTIVYDAWGGWHRRPQAGRRNLMRDQGRARSPPSTGIGALKRDDRPLAQRRLRTFILPSS